MDLETLKEIAPWDWPGEAGEVLMETLRDPASTEKDRIDAADLASNLVVMNNEVAELLLSLVSSVEETDELRAQAAISLGPALEEAEIDGFDSDSPPSISEEMFHRIQKELHEAYIDGTTPKEVRRRVLEASIRASADWHQEAIRTAYESPDHEWNLTAAFAMRYVPGFEAEILKLLFSPNPDIQYEAVCAAGSHELDAAWTHVSGLLKSHTTDKNLLLAAIEASASIRPEEAAPMLDLLVESEDDDISGAASEALFMTQEPMFLDEEIAEEDDEEEGQGGKDRWVH